MAAVEFLAVVALFAFTFGAIIWTMKTVETATAACAIGLRNKIRSSTGRRRPDRLGKPAARY
jgi:hypothetical protein